MSKATHIPIKRAVNNILRVYAQAHEIEHEMGFWWYVEALRWCEETAQEFRSETQTIAGIVAALSPGVSWEQNKMDARDFLRFITGEKMTVSVSTYGQFINKARDIWDGKEIEKVLNGPKITAFYRCIINPWCNESVCVDRHAFKVARGIKKGGSKALTPKQVRDTQQAYRNAAYQLGLRPLQLQAITWTTYKRIHNR